MLVLVTLGIIFCIVIAAPIPTYKIVYETDPTCQPCLPDGKTCGMCNLKKVYQIKWNRAIIYQVLGQ